jgi:hypothetical protein
LDVARGCCCHIHLIYLRKVFFLDVSLCWICRFGLAPQSIAALDTLLLLLRRNEPIPNCCGSRLYFLLYFSRSAGEESIGHQCRSSDLTFDENITRSWYVKLY